MGRRLDHASSPAGSRGDGPVPEVEGLRSRGGRDPASVGLEVWVSTAEGKGPEDWRRALEGWKAAGVTHVTLNTTYGRGPHTRIPGRTLADHITAMRDYIAAVKDLA